MPDVSQVLEVAPQLADQPEAAAQLAAACTHHRASTGDILIAEGEPANSLLGILEGDIEILRSFGTGQRVMSRLGAGTLLGEAAMVPGLTRTASVRAATPVHYLRLPAAAFRDAMIQSPQAVSGLIERQLRRLAERENEYLAALQAGIVSRDKELAELRLGHAAETEAEGIWPPSLEPLLERTARLARAELPILVTGESGTGKELLARFIHRHSPRSAGPLRSLNCAAIPAEIAEAELFGVSKGAYTGADRDRPGLLKSADGGTLFLDEIGDLQLAQQAKLLRALQDGNFYPVGSQSLENTDVRLVSATNKDLASEVAGGRFREDLLYRVAGARVELPPLRERRDHIPMLATWMVERALPEVEAGWVLAEVMPVLVRHRWPGNVRQLMSVIKAALALAEEYPRLQLVDLPDELVATDPGAALPSPPAGSVDADDLAAQLAGRNLADYLRDCTVALIRSALAAHDGVRKDAAQALGLTPQNFSNYLRRLDIKPPK